VQDVIGARVPGAGRTTGGLEGESRAGEAVANGGDEQIALASVEVPA
jgi:hypothetical protein